MSRGIRTRGSNSIFINRDDGANTTARYERHDTGIAKTRSCLTKSAFAIGDGLIIYFLSNDGASTRAHL